MAEKQRTRHPSLDEVLEQIQTETTQQVIEESKKLLDPQAEAAVLTLLGTIEEERERHVPATESSPLSARQRSLPRLPLAMYGAIAAVMFLVVGLGSTVLLSQQSQDIRQQAYEGSAKQSRVLASPGVSGQTLQEASQDTLSQSGRGVSPRVLIGGFFLTLSALAFLALLWWWFVV